MAGSNISSRTVFDSFFNGPPGRSNGRGGGGVSKPPHSKIGGQRPGSGKTLGIVLETLASIIPLLGFIARVWAEFVWLEQLGRFSVALTIWGWRTGLALMVTLLAAVITWVNLTIASKTSPCASQRVKVANRRNAEKKMDEAKRKVQRDQNSATAKAEDEAEKVEGLELESEKTFKPSDSQAFEKELH